ncbi:MAG: ribonuclease Z [Bacteroidia bacterium]
MTFELTILGSSSATPLINRHPSAQVLNYHERFFLIDCGEGTQMQMLQYKVKMSKIQHILISHLHGDHYLGLMGLLFTMHLNGRLDELHVYGQPELMDIIDLQLKLSNTILRFTLIFHPVQHYRSVVIYDDDDFQISTIILNHRIPCTGFLFREKMRMHKLNMDEVAKYDIPVSKLNRIKAGEDFTDADGNIIKNEKLILPPQQLRSYAYCSDTIYDEEIIPYIKGVDLLYHEATFGDEMKERAQATFHSTAKQAATIARKAEVKRLMIGHFSARYKELQTLLDEAQTVFENTELAIEGNLVQVGEC